jgi:hypothetical protein
MRQGEVGAEHPRALPCEQHRRGPAIAPSVGHGPAAHHQGHLSVQIQHIRLLIGHKTMQMLGIGYIFLKFFLSIYL